MSIAMTAFDTLKYAEEPQAAGVPEAQAKAHARVTANAFETQLERLVTKDDLRVAITDLRIDMDKLRGEMSLIRWMVGPSLIGTMATFAGMMTILIKNFA